MTCRFDFGDGGFVVYFIWCANVSGSAYEPQRFHMYYVICVRKEKNRTNYI